MGSGPEAARRDSRRNCAYSLNVTLMLTGSAKILAIVIISFLTLVSAEPAGRIQEKYPDPPADLTRVYFSGDRQTLTALPFERGLTSIDVFHPALRDRTERVLIKGRKAATVFHTGELEFYVFVGEKMDPPPHQLVRLATEKTNRQLAISVIRGQKGYAPFAMDNVPLQRQLLERLSVKAGQGRILFVNYLRLRPKQPLTPGEYAIIGDSLADIATFRVE